MPEVLSNGQEKARLGPSDLAPFLPGSLRPGSLSPAPPTWVPPTCPPPTCLSPSTLSPSHLPPPRALLPGGPLRRLSASSETAPDVDIFFSRAAPEAAAPPGLLSVSSLLARLS